MVKKGEKMPESQKEKIRQSRIGKKHTMETKQIISQKNKGKVSYWKGKSNPGIHKNLGKYAEGIFGEESPNWKGGKIFANGYYYIYNVKLGKAFGGKYIKRANYNWFMETGELIAEPYFLHHINWDKTDDRIENLQKMKRGEHSKFTTMFIQRNPDGRFRKK